MLMAFDNARGSSRPSKWDMRRVLSVSSLLALLGVAQSLGLLGYLHHRLGMGDPLRTAMFMQLVIAGHLLLFSTRSWRFFFEPPFPEWGFFTALIGTQVLAALMAANGWLVASVSWGLIGFIRLYNLLLWLAVIDLAKVALFHRHNLRETKQVSWQKWFHSPLGAFGGRLGKPSTAG